MRVRTDRFRALCAERGWHTEAQQAAGLGIHRTTINRALRGVAEAGPVFVGACKRAWPDIPMDYLFEVQTLKQKVSA